MTMPPSCLRVSLSLPSGLHPTDVCTSTCLPIYYPVLASLEDDDVIPTGSRLSDLRVVAEKYRHHCLALLTPGGCSMVLT